MSGLGYKGKPIADFDLPKAGEKVTLISGTLDIPCAPGSIIHHTPCCVCGEKVWLAPSSQAMLKSGVKIDEVYCLDCFEKTKIDLTGMRFTTTAESSVISMELKALREAENKRRSKIPGRKRRAN